MFQKIKKFWESFWDAFKSAYNLAFKGSYTDNTQSYYDTRHNNFLAIFVSKLNNLVNIEATFDIESNSTRTNALKDLCKDLETKRFDITSDMLGTGDLWVFPAHDGSGALYHRCIACDRVSILGMDGDRITDLLAIIDTYTDQNNRTYFLIRHHVLTGDKLTIETYTVNEDNKRTTLDEWTDFESAYEIAGVDNIGVGRFKSPASSRGKEPVYGVPLNYGCAEIEENVFNDLKLIETEFKNAKSKIFADPLILRKGRDKTGDEGYQMPENIYPIDTRGGQTNAHIDIFSPAIRYSEYHAKLLDDMARYEQQVGTDKGFLTPFESTTATTATEIRRANASTIALIDKIHATIKKGVEETLKADAMILGISDDLYTVNINWYDPFADEDAQYQRLANAVDRGVAEKTDEMQWLFPNLTTEELGKKLERIEATKAVNTDAAIENILGTGA